MVRERERRTVGVPFETRQQRLVLPANTPAFKMVLSGRPLAEGGIFVKGLSIADDGLVRLLVRLLLLLLAVLRVYSDIGEKEIRAFNMISEHFLGLDGRGVPPYAHSLLTSCLM